MMTTENPEPMVKFSNLDNILTEFISVAITTTWDNTLGYRTQIHGGKFNGKLWIAKTWGRAEYYHLIATRMVLKDPTRNSLGPEGEIQIQI